MKRIYNDLKICLSDIRNIGERFIIRFYTTSKATAIERTDADVITEQDGEEERKVLKLSWSELSTVGKGVLQYEACNLTDDADYDDGVYDSTWTVTTDLYIMADVIIDDDDPEKPMTEIVAEIRNDLTRESADRKAKDNEIDDALAGLETTSDLRWETVNSSLGDIRTQVNGKQDKLTAGANITIEDNVISATVTDIDLEDYYTKEEIDENELVISSALNDLNTRLNGTYTKSEVDKAIDDAISAGADLTNYYTKAETDTALSAKQDALAFYSEQDTEEEVAEDTVETYKATDIVTGNSDASASIRTQYSRVERSGVTSSETAGVTVMAQNSSDGDIYQTTFEAGRHAQFHVAEQGSDGHLSHAYLNVQPEEVNVTLEYYGTDSERRSTEITLGHDGVKVNNAALALASEVYTKTEIDNKIGDIETLLGSI